MLAHSKELAQQKITAVAPFVDTYWPEAIKGFNPYPYTNANPHTHYFATVLTYDKRPEWPTLDPVFDNGLFGYFSNGLTAVLLALSMNTTKTQVTHKKKRGEAASDVSDAPLSREVSHEKIKETTHVIIDYVAMVALQFYSIVNARWLASDCSHDQNNSSQQCGGGPRIQPVNTMFYMHHGVDGDLRNHHDSKKDVAGKVNVGTFVDPVYKALIEKARGPLGKADFIVFLQHIFNYIEEKIQALCIARTSDMSSVNKKLRYGCKKLQLNTKGLKTAIDSRLKNAIKTNHTSWFTCNKFKMLPIHNLSNLVCQQFQQSKAPTSAAAVLRGAKSVDTIVMTPIIVKYFPHHNDNTFQMSVTKGLDKEKSVDGRQFCNPYFWSHLTFRPDRPLVFGQSWPVFDNQNPEVLADSVLQRLVLRNMLYCLNKDHSEVLMDCIKDVDQLGVNFKPEANVSLKTMDSEQFVNRFVLTSALSKKFDLVTLREHQLTGSNVALIKPVVSSAQLRYTIKMEAEIAKQYVPALSHDFGSFPICDESDILSMSPQRFWALLQRGKDPREPPPLTLDIKCWKKAGILREVTQNECADVKQLDILCNMIPGIRTSHSVDGIWVALEPLKPGVLCYDSKKYRLLPEEKQFLTDCFSSTGNVLVKVPPLSIVGCIV